MELFPFSILPGIRLFSSQNTGIDDFGIEVDNLLHIRLGGVDYVVVIEAKNQAIEIDSKGNWWARYNTGPKDIRKQLDAHIGTLWGYLEPIARDVNLKFIAIVCSGSPHTKHKPADGLRGAKLHLTSVYALPELLNIRFNLTSSKTEVLRVAQSSFLNLLRLGLPVPALGHPELLNAIRYVERCRRSLDESLFKHFQPTTGRWAINGTAGMGKSVLLAYAAAVFSCGLELYNWHGESGLKSADTVFSKIGFDANAERGVVGIIAMSSKQLESIQGWYNQFVTKFQGSVGGESVRFQTPEFLRCHDRESIRKLAGRCRALLVDEAHDLPAFAAREIAELHNSRQFYLVVACDRHQKLRFAGSGARIIDGVDFSGRGKRLNQVYRNPAPVYIASLALMFRWFATDGPKVMPSISELKSGFGFEAELVRGNDYKVTIRSDAHPANSWSHTVATYPSAKIAYTALTRESVGRRDVLWVRFCEEDVDFDYEQLATNFTYHNCRASDAHIISDKYIKGQDYPIVVIEGFPSFMDRVGSDGAQEEKMWAFRRELYLCSSRATCFLYFVCNVAETPEILRVKDEMKLMVAAIGRPCFQASGGTKSWTFFIKDTKDRRSLNVFADSVSVETSERNESVTGLAVIAPKILPIPTVKDSPLDHALPSQPPSTAEPHPPSDSIPQRALEEFESVPSTDAVQDDDKANSSKNERPKVYLPAVFNARELASALGIGVWQLIEDLGEMNIAATPNQLLNPRIGRAVCESYGFHFVLVS